MLSWFIGQGAMGPPPTPPPPSSTPTPTPTTSTIGVTAGGHVLTPVSSSGSTQQTINPQNVAVTIAMQGGGNIAVPITSLVAQSQTGELYVYTVIVHRVSQKEVVRPTWDFSALPGLPMPRFTCPMT